MEEKIDWLTHGEKDILLQLIEKEISYITFLIQRYRAELESGTLAARETANTSRNNIFTYQKKIDTLQDIKQKIQ